MSVTSATESFTEGAELFEQDKYRSTVEIDLEPDLDNPHQMEHPFNRPLSQRIVPIPSHTNKVDLTRLDDILVRCPSKAFRDYQQLQWNNVKKEAEEKKTSWTYTAIGTGIVATIGGALALCERTDVAKYLGKSIADSPVAPVLLIAGAVFTLVSIIFIAKASSSMSQANDQISKWDVDPLLKICKERDEAHNEGFPHIYARRLKLEQGPSDKGRLHPTHVEYEYKKYVKAFCQRLLEQSNPEPNGWMKIFICSNPFSSPAMAYGLGDIPDHMKPVVEDFTRFESFLSDITSSYDRMKSDVRANAKERIDHLTKIRDELALPFATIRNSSIRAAKKNRDDILDNLASTVQEKRDARRDYEIREKTLKDSYTLSTAPNNNKYNAKIAEAEKDRDQRIAKLDEQKNNQLGNNYRAARELLVRAKEAWDNRGYQPVRFEQYFPYQNAQPVWLNQPVFAPPVVPQTVYYQPQPPAYQPPVQPQPDYYQPQQPVFVPPVEQPVYYQETPNIYPQVPQPVNPGYGQFGYGHAPQQIPTQQYYYYVQPAAPYKG